MRKRKETAEDAPAAEVETVTVRQLRAGLRNILRADHPCIVENRGRAAAIILPTGAMGWEHRYDTASHVRQVRRMFAAAVEKLDKGL
jgi:hypothetical protein